MSKEGKYIYCIVETNGEEKFGPIGIGNRGDELYKICYMDIGSVVSSSPIIKYKISRENSLTHERAIEEVMNKGYTVLPVRFGTIAESEEKVRDILAIEYNEFKNLLKKMKNKVELGIKAIFHEKIIYQDILNGYEKIKRLKEEIASMPLEKTYYQRLEIGRMVEAALEEQKTRYREEILNTLRKSCCEFHLSDRLIGERMIINAAFLVDREQEREFDKRVNGLAEKYGEKIKFKYVGNIPPFNFVNLVIKLGEA